MYFKYLGYLFFFALMSAQENTALFEKWIKQLSARSWKIREKATKELIQQSEKAFPALQVALSSRDPEVLWRVQYILAQAPVVESSEISEFQQQIQDFCGYDQRRIFQAEKFLRKMGASALPHLQKALENERKASIRNRLINLIQEIQLSQQDLPDPLKPDSSRIEREFQLALRDFYNEKKQYLGIAQLKALGEEAFPYLVQEVQKTSINYNKRMQLIQILGLIRKKEMVDCLVQLTEDSDQQISQFAHQKLSVVTGQQKITRLRWKEWWDTNRVSFEFPN